MKFLTPAEKLCVRILLIKLCIRILKVPAQKNPSLGTIWKTEITNFSKRTRVTAPLTTALVLDFHVFCIYPKFCLFSKLSVDAKEICQSRGCQSNYLKNHQKWTKIGRNEETFFVKFVFNPFLVSDFGYDVMLKSIITLRLNSPASLTDS